MKKHHRITKHERGLEETLNLEKSLRVRVIGKNGTVIGLVSQIRIHPTNMKIEGILVKRGIFKRPLYIGASYINRLSHESFILHVNPTVLLKGKRVLNSEGKYIGKVKHILRKKHSNELEEIVISSLFRKPFVLPMSSITLIGDSIVLKAHYHAKKKAFTKKSK